LYKDKYAAAGITDKVSVTKCPSNEGDRFDEGIKHFGIVGASWIYHPGPYNALQSNTWVEGTHTPVSGETDGAWFFASPGSGLWVNLGNTKAYEEHGNVFSEFTDCNSIGGPGEYMHLFCKCAKQHGLDSLQFLAHDDGEWDCPGVGPAKSGGGSWQIGSSPLAIELVILGLDGSKSCGGVKNAYRAGWMASEACDCIETDPIRAYYSAGPANCRNKGIAPR